ncbi:MAG TPA: hypothetical protein PK464_04575, partial [Candidatus Marinimicrobia bacterium]|nr:hypothetical protein [Candidatus Neomarinimicrobiota bacterium]
MKKFTVLTICLLVLGGLSGTVSGQQVIGEFPTMDGGFEGQTVGTLTPQSIAAGVQTTNFTCEGNNGTGIQNSVARTGAKSVNLYYNGTSTKRILQSPTADAGLVTNSTYTIQYYYRTPGTTGTLACMQVGANISGTSGTTPKYYPSSAPYTTLNATDGSWAKVAYTTAALTGTSSSSTYGIGIIRVNAGSSQLMQTAIDVDDFIMYAGALDETAPDAPTSPTIAGETSSSLDVSWTAPVTGVDGGGYLVVRGSADPTTA